MKLEEVLPLLREGKKARNINFDEDGEYWIAGYNKLPDFYDDDKNLIVGDKFLTIHRLNKEDKVICNSHSWGIPCWLVMYDGWEIVE